MLTRPYLPMDRDACLALFDGNVPRYFASGEREAFAAFLDQPGCAYFVMEHEGAPVACGGFRLADERRARLVWGLVRSDLHRMGLGRFLLLFRLREIGKAGDFETVEAETSAEAAPFFESQGFRIVRVDRNGYGPGRDRMEVVKRLTVCA